MTKKNNATVRKRLFMMNLASFTPFYLLRYALVCSIRSLPIVMEEKVEHFLYQIMTSVKKKRELKTRGISLNLFEKERTTAISTVLLWLNLHRVRNANYMMRSSSLIEVR